MTSPDSDPPGPHPGTGAAPPPTASLAQVVRAVAWSFFGVRKGKDMQEDATTIKPAQVVLVGLAAALVFVLALVALVTFITRSV